jgi:hypothetical protein
MWIALSDTISPYLLAWSFNYKVRKQLLQFYARKQFVPV